MRELERGASYPAVRDNDVLNEVIPVPPLPEQRKIAAVLGGVQRAMEQQERLLALTAELRVEATPLRCACLCVARRQVHHPVVARL